MVTANCKAHSRSAGLINKGTGHLYLNPRLIRATCRRADPAQAFNDSSLPIALTLDGVASLPKWMLTFQSCYGAVNIELQASAAFSLTRAFIQ
jgi:hypothetical protein